ncbi:MAG TPA: lantibiotic dehydratase [Streptosporangiaceae bacterium]|nr:lantibiotic dehydratase [Streptosporangiaceae bacterium]
MTEASATKGATPAACLRNPAPTHESLAPGSLIPLPGGFHLWSQGALRSGGFPISGLLELGDPGYAAAVDRWLDDPSDGTRQTLDTEATRAATRQAALLRQIARRADFQEAVTWQNPDLVEPMIVTLGQMDPDAPNNQRLRKRQRIVAKYWARYCSKNETIGFFGPVSWFDFRSEGEPLRMKPGSSLVHHGELFLEPWAIDALAASLCSDPEVRPWVAPRRHPTVYIAGNQARTLGGPVELDEDEARLLALVDGHRAGKEIAAEYGAEPTEVYEALDRLAAKGLLIWDLEPPMWPHAERHLRTRLEAIADPDVREHATGVLGRLEAARDALAGYRDADDLRRLYGQLEHEFTELTGVDPARRPGQAYGGRRLAYVECVRDVALSFGPQVVQSCAEPFSLLLTSARWFAHEAAQRLRAVLSEAFDAMGAEVVGFNQLVFSCADKVFIPGNRPLDHLSKDFATNWRAILGLDTDARVVTHTSEALRGQVEAAFAGGHPSWGFAWMHSIDLLIAARGAEEFHRGEFQPVIGEVHIAYCPFETTVFALAHPNMEELRAMLAEVIPDTRVMLSPVKDYPRVAARTYPWLNDARDWRLCVSQYPPRGEDRQLPLCGLEVRRDGDKLVVGLPGAADQFDVTDICGAWMMYEMIDVLKQVVRGHDHTPRVVVDNLVVFRETWSFPIAELDWVSARSDPEHFVAARRWLRERGLPETVFASISSETKPVFVDFRSEVQVGNLAQLLRTGAETEGATVTFSEMLPTPEQSWLSDAAGNPYTAELRLVFVDGHTGS